MSQTLRNGKFRISVRMALMVLITICFISLHLYYRYFQEKDKFSLMKYLCEDRVLKNSDIGSKCLYEVPPTAKDEL